jgi:ferrous iron transport protein A
MAASRNLAELSLGESAIVHELHLPEAFAHRLMQMGFLPGTIVEAAHAAPSGDPRVFRVDGSEVALRRETAEQITVRPR